MLERIVKYCADICLIPDPFLPGHVRAMKVVGKYIIDVLMSGLITDIFGGHQWHEVIGFVSDVLKTVVLRLRAMFVERFDEHDWNDESRSAIPDCLMEFFHSHSLDYVIPLTA
jgi:hypothetical protein